MTNYELIQMLVECPPDVEIQFKVGGLTGYDCSIKYNDYKYYPQLNPELYIIIEE